MPNTSIQRKEKDKEMRIRNFSLYSLHNTKFTKKNKGFKRAFKNAQTLRVIRVTTAH